MNIYKIWENYLDVLKKYAVFHGRAKRAEYWWFVLANLIISLALGIIGKDLSRLYDILVFIPSLAVAVRRMHDRDRSGHFLWLLLIPIVGWIIVIVQLAKRSKNIEDK